ncbi:mannose-6-phosphate isomerase [Fulvivirga sp. RKSG066]|uniref:type I phosphomannose isomerase catalytic subunit n=1 Tax=Fulvivirga aurantia TaxID=2529383 RepID=UPI0012BCE6C0|nr:type I phosphomannose isomerase catalytic subunit [Fulvivirga aurantia]MTI21174.1 mannose-6-phosphate isomerase [Fulvivirga aurantia]
MSDLYPLTFKTIFKEKIWGGDKIKTVLNKDFAPLSNCGETWELSAVDNEVSKVANGALAGKGLDELITTYKEELIGKSVYEKHGTQFPLLVKFIDANADLSIQVHPDDHYARQFYGPQASGKSEMWYVMQADEGASLISGFSKPTDKEDFRKRLQLSRIEELLNQEEVAAGDVFYVPAGRIHTIGKGLLIAEIQQTSDTTYRVYDFDRTDANGNKRELHIDKAVEVMDYEVKDNYKTGYETNLNATSPILDTPFFVVNKLKIDQNNDRDYSSLDSFVILVGLEGNAVVNCDSGEQKIGKGDVFLIPAAMKNLSINPVESAELLEVYIR